MSNLTIPTGVRIGFTANKTAEEAKLLVDNHRMVICQGGELYMDGTRLGLTTDEYARLAQTLPKEELDKLLAAKANAADVYTKAALDPKLAAKADAASVYSKGELDPKLQAKANAAEVYKKTEIDPKLSAKADASSVYTKTQTYSKSEVDEKIRTTATGCYYYQGSKETIGEVTALTSFKKGDVWNVAKDFELGGKKYPAGTNVAATADSSTANPALWDALGGSVDLTPYLTKAEASGTYATKSALTQAQNALQGSLSAKADASAVYKKGETYSRNEVDTKLSAKANASDLSAKADVSALNAKANSADVYIKSQVYTKGETDAKVSELANRVKALEDLMKLA